MADYDVFNGDADGICALLQLRLAEPRQSTLVTGVKRDINLLAKVDASSGDRLTVLDISMDKNNQALTNALNEGALVQYSERHLPGEIPEHTNPDANIDTDAEVCTGLLVNKHLNNQFLPWAVTAAFGDNLHKAAHLAAEPLQPNESQLTELGDLGTLLNYNGYGATIEDLFFAPDKLFETLLPYPDPFDFIKSDSTFATLKQGYASDMANAKAIGPHFESADCAMFVFPQASW